LLIVWLCCKRKTYEGLVNMPTQEQKTYYIEQILRNKELFTGESTLNEAVNKLSWIDVVIYEDLRMLYDRGEFTKQNISRIIDGQSLSQKN